MSTTRSQKRRNVQQESTGNVSESSVSPVVVRNEVQTDQGILIAVPSDPKSPRIENSTFESLRVSLKDEITSDINGLLEESQKEILKLLRPKTNENTREEAEDELENETRSFYIPTKSVRITLPKTTTRTPVVTIAS